MASQRMADVPRVIILGCGFGGLYAARALARARVRITLIDRSNHHLFQPLLYEVATAGLSAPAVAAPIRHILARQRNLRVLLGEAEAIDPDSREVRLKDGEVIGYDWLIVATGATHSYFGRDEWRSLAPGLKTLADAFAIRERILLAYERAEREDDPVCRKKLMTFAVIGAGATGVELAGTLAEIARHTLRHEFRRIDSRASSVVLIEGSERVLPLYDPVLSGKAREQLEHLGVEVRTRCLVRHIDENGIEFDTPQGRERLEAGTVIWAAGIAASPLGRTLSVPLDRAGRVIAEPDLSVPGHPEIFVVGDLAAMTSDGKAVPGVAPAAKQMGRCAARNLLKRLNGSATRPFRYVDYGSLATIGRESAVLQIGRLHMWGLPAWLFWLFLHICFLIGFRSRLLVLIEWAWSYFTFSRAARIIVGKDPAERQKNTHDQSG